MQAVPTPQALLLPTASVLTFLNNNDRSSSATEYLAMYKDA